MKQYRQNFKSYFVFTASQRIGLLILFALIILIQAFYCFSDFTKSEKYSSEQLQWLALQMKVDSLKQNQFKKEFKIYPFNPNFITDYKGYQLGMSTEEIDRLLKFRETNRFVNSAEEFQNVTEISDSLLKIISPYFKFPDWVSKKKALVNKRPVFQNDFEKKSKIVLKDINEASQEDLIKVYGIGSALSERILREKEKLGGFVSLEQLKEIWGLSDEVIENLQKQFTVLTVPQVKKVNINNASVKELSQFPYFKYVLAKEIVLYRSMNGGIKGQEDLKKINGFPIEKVKVIALYLDF